MGLMLAHPNVATIDCADCQKYIYDFETGKRKTYRSGPNRDEKPQVRPSNVPTLCRTSKGCPKGTPETAHQYLLSAKNAKTLRLFQIMKATDGASVTEAMRRDKLLMDNFAEIDGLMAEHEASELKKMSDQVKHAAKSKR